MKIVKMKRVIPKPKQVALRHLGLGKIFLLYGKVYTKVEGINKGSTWPCINLANGKTEYISFYDMVIIPLDVVLQVKLT